MSSLSLSPDGSSQATGENKTHNPQPRVRRRNRLITSCLECRRRKLKCDKGHPCANCTKISRPCVFIASGMDADAQAKLADVKEKMGILERSLEEDVTRRTKTSSSTIDSGPINLPGQDLSYSDQEEDEDTKNLPTSYLVTEDAAYYENEDNDDMVDLGIAMGRLRVTERIGGLVRPRIVEELANALKEIPMSDRFSNSNPMFEEDPQSWLGPSRDYLAPSSSFFFAPGVERSSLMTHLPAKALVDKLIAHYWIAVHTIARTVHRPLFERQYDNFWTQVNAGIEPRNSFQAVVFAALLSSIISMSEDKVLTDFGIDKQSLVENFKEGTEAALARANFLRTTKLETLQAFVMYLIPLCRKEVSIAHSALTGTLIRLAECMGLHRDPTTYSTSPVEIHVRRLVWYQICFLDLRTCDATGPRPQIRPDDFDTRFPLNIDDVDLDRADKGENGVDVRNDRTYFTDMTITRMRFECYEMYRVLWTERPKLDRKKANGTREITVTSILARLQAFMAAMEKTYVPMLNNTLPLHALAAAIYGILSNRLYIMLLQKYLSSDRTKMPPRLRQVVISASVLIIENAMTVEQHPALSTWSWYLGAFTQYHPAILLMSELYAAPPDAALEQRVWRCLDFVFELPDPSISIPEKLRTILEGFFHKSQIYTRMKKVRAPNSMPHVGPRTHTPGYQIRQQQEREERDRSASLPSTTSPTTNPLSFSAGGSPIAQQPLQSPPILPRLSYAAQAFSGAVPNVDWGTIDLPGSSSTFQSQAPPPQGLSTPGTKTYSDFASVSPPPGGLIPMSTMAAGGVRHGSDSASPGAPIYGGMPGSTAGSSPLDALNEIDWNDIEQMFGGAEMGAGNMMIPPFTFPTFEVGNLEWTGAGELQGSGAGQ